MFPCHFGTYAVENGDLLYTYMPSLTDPDALFALRDATLEYLDTCREHAGRAPFVVFFAPPDRTFDEADWHEATWHVLQFLHVSDPAPTTSRPTRTTPALSSASAGRRCS